jgi:CMP-N-acetylneuraminic acid synthetase
MIGNKRVVCIIPARAGSKGIPGKNIKLIGGKPLIGWAIDVAKAVPEIDRIIVSTDGEEIAAVARQFGAEVAMRPAELAGDRSPTADALRYHTSEIKAAGDDFHYLLLLEPTTPFRTADDVRACIRMIDEDGLDSVATYAPAAESPWWAFTLEGKTPKKLLEGGMVQRQQLPAVYHLNGAAYIYIADKLPEDSGSILFGNQGAVVMERVRSIDIDEPLDMLIAEAVAKSGLLAPS